MRKKYIGLSLCLLLGLNVHARSEKNIDDMIADYEKWPLYENFNAEPSEYERALAKDVAARIISL